MTCEISTFNASRNETRRNGTRAIRSEILSQLVVQTHGMLHAVPDRRLALTAQATKLSRPGAGNHRIRLLGDPIFEHAGTLEYETPRLPGEPSGYALQADERGGAIRAVHHQVFHVALALDVVGEGLRDPGSGQLRHVRAFTVRLFVPILDGKLGVRAFLHVSPAPVVSVGHVESWLRQIFRQRIQSAPPIEHGSM